MNSAPRLPVETADQPSAALVERLTCRYLASGGDIRAVQLEVTEGNVPAIALYESLGFTAYGVEPLAVLTPGGFRSKVHMWLALPGPPCPVGNGCDAAL